MIQQLLIQMHQQCLIQSQSLFRYLAQMRSEGLCVKYVFFFDFYTLINTPCVGITSAMTDELLWSLWEKTLQVPKFLAEEIFSMIIQTFSNLPRSVICKLLQDITRAIHDSGSASDRSLQCAIIFVKKLRFYVSYTGI